MFSILITGLCLTAALIPTEARPFQNALGFQPTNNLRVAKVYSPEDWSNPYLWKEDNLYSSSSTSSSSAFASASASSSSSFSSSSSSSRRLARSPISFRSLKRFGSNTIEKKV